MVSKINVYLLLLCVKQCQGFRWIMCYSLSVLCYYTECMAVLHIEHLCIRSDLNQNEPLIECCHRP